VKRLFVIALLLVGLAGCDGIEIRFEEPPVDNRRTPAVPIEYPTVNLPRALRQANWRGNEGEGSCVHASMISLFRWQGRYATADYWRRTYGNGEWAAGLADKMEREKAGTWSVSSISTSSGPVSWTTTTPVKSPGFRDARSWPSGSTAIRGR